MKKIELPNFQHGAVIDLFNEELEKVLVNIRDENTEAKEERSVTIKIAIKPDKTRRTGEVKVQAYATLAKIKPAESFVFFDVDEDGKFAAFEDDPGPELPGINEKEPVKFPRASEG
jgi:superfamily I DNA and RNA helicase